MSNLYWLQPGWTETTCCSCGEKIWPEGDPDWGMCFDCYSREIDLRAQEQEYYEEMQHQYEEYLRDNF